MAAARASTPTRPAGGPQIGPYIFGKTLGTGATGKVKLAKHVETGEMVAIKIVRKEYLARKPSLKKKLQREITVMKLCNHPNVLRLLDVFDIDTHLFLVLEYIDGCELFQYLVQKGKLPADETLKFFQQIIAGLEYCHRRLICHRDLKPENLLLDRDLNLKVADFGMTNLNPPGSLLETSCGSPHYAAPEVVSGEMYNGLEADIWSCGVILYAMLTGRLPFDDDNVQRLLLKVQRGVFHIPSDMPAECKSLVRGMMTVNPQKRITIDEIKKNEWFNSVPIPAEMKDDFVAPEEPITDANPAVLHGLVDLGWGDLASVNRELNSNEANLVKVFYIQLERHPMFHKNSQKSMQRVPAKAKPESRSSLAMLKKQMAEHANNQKGSSSQADESSPREEGKAEPGSPLPQGDKDEPAAKSVETNGQWEARLSEDKRSPSLVRQAELMGSKVKDVGLDMNALTIKDHSSGDGPEKSWFDNFTMYFGGDEPKPK